MKIIFKEILLGSALRGSAFNRVISSSYGRLAGEEAANVKEN